MPSNIRIRKTISPGHWQPWTLFGQRRYQHSRPTIFLDTALFRHRNLIIIIYFALTKQDTSGQKFTVVLLDSEGIEAVTSEGSDDHCIFTLTILLASVLIYNSAGVPTRNDVDGLEYLFGVIFIY